MSNLGPEEDNESVAYQRARADGLEDLLRWNQDRVRELEAQIRAQNTCACCKTALIEDEKPSLCETCEPSFEQYERDVGRCCVHPNGVE